MNEESARKLQEEAFWSSPLDSEEREYEAAAENFAPCENQAELRQLLMESARNTMEAKKTKKRPVTINLDNEAVAYFKELAADTGIAYQNLINMFLVQCARERKHPVFV